MLNISENHLKLLSWINSKSNLLEYSHLKLQKFLYFYEMFQLVDGKHYDIKSLKAYRNGPVFSDVYGDYCYRKEELISAINSANSFLETLNKSNVEKARFLVSTLTDEELSKLTHCTDMWLCKEERICQGEKHISINETDITERDKEFIESVKRGCYCLDDYKILSILNKNFLFNKSDEQKLKEEHYQVLEQLSNVDELVNPVYINIDEKGVILVD